VTATERIASSLAKKLPDRDDDTEETDLDTIPLFACISDIWHFRIWQERHTSRRAAHLLKLPVGRYQSVYDESFISLSLEHFRDLSQNGSQDARLQRCG
jgi:hypothetical protein